MAINTSVISASIRDLVDDAPGDMDAELVIRNSKAFFHGTELITPFEERAAFDVNGDASIEVIETETPGVKLDFFIRINAGERKRVIRFKPAIVPDDATADLADLTEVDQYATF